MAPTPPPRLTHTHTIHCGKNYENEKEPSIRNTSGQYQNTIYRSRYKCVFYPCKYIDFSLVLSVLFFLVAPAPFIRLWLRMAAKRMEKYLRIVKSKVTIPWEPKPILTHQIVFAYVNDNLTAIHAGYASLFFIFLPVCFPVFFLLSTFDFFSYIHSHLCVYASNLNIL